MFLFRTTKVATLSSVENDVNLYSKAGSPNHPINYIVFNTANKGASSTSTPAMRTGSFKDGSLVYLQNSASITGASGAAGANGPGGAGGVGQGYGVPNSTAGSNGGNGSSGGNGGPAFKVDTTNVKIVLHNGSGSIVRGAGGPGGTGGGGGGGGGNQYSV